MIDIKEVLLRWFINFLTKKTSSKAIKNEVMSNKELAGEFQKPIITKAEKTKYTHLF